MSLGTFTEKRYESSWDTTGQTTIMKNSSLRYTFPCTSPPPLLQSILETDKVSLNERLRGGGGGDTCYYKGVSLSTPFVAYYYNGVR